MGPLSLKPKPSWSNLKRSRRLLLHFVLALIALLSVLPGAANATCDNSTIGMNKFDLALQYIGRASGGDGSAEYTKVTRAMARKAIDDASQIGVAYFRIAATGFAPARAGQPSDLELWLKDSSQYWASIDLMMADLQAANICVIPVLAWNIFQFPAMASEPLGALLRNPRSASWQLLNRYVHDFVTRYHDKPNLLFYELTNELNNHVDIDAERNCRNKKAADDCTLVTNFTTSEMNEFIDRFASLVRSLDQTHRISSGFSIPRPAAQHLRRRPQWSTGGADWTPDSADELEANLRDIHASVDIISVHLYPPASLRMGLAPGDEFKIVDIVQAAAAKIGKPLFVGEFGQRDILHVPEKSFVSNMILELEKLEVPYSAAWVWEFYQFATDTPYQSEPSSFSLEPGYTDKLIEEIGQVNLKRRPQTRSQNLAEANSAPTVVLTKPLECSTVAPGSELFAVASHGARAVGSVDFFIDGHKIGHVTDPPYRSSVPSSERTSGTTEIEARACSNTNKCNSYKTRVIFGQDPQSTKQCSSKSL